MDETTQAGEIDVATGLIRLSFLVQSTYGRASERHDLTPVQAKLLCVLADSPRCMAELAALFGVEKAALTGLVDRAERRGFVHRAPVPGDRRALLVTLTPQGHQAAAAFLDDVKAEVSGLASDLRPDDREHFRATLAQMIRGSETS
jgi:DNA-binding MarR family transcriptional regulator